VCAALGGRGGLDPDEGVVVGGEAGGGAYGMGAVRGGTGGGTGGRMAVGLYMLEY
jgi:hypothetical protein